jgi:hypothetical protein
LQTAFVAQNGIIPAPDMKLAYTLNHSITQCDFFGTLSAMDVSFDLSLLFLAQIRRRLAYKLSCSCNASIYPTSGRFVGVGRATAHFLVGGLF